MAQGGEQSSQTMGKLPRKYRGQVDKMLAKADASLGNSYASGPLVAGSNQNIEQGQQGALDAAQAQQGTVNQLQNTFGNLANYGSGNDQLLQNRLNDIATLSNRNLNENIMPSLRTGAVQAGQTGSSRQGIAEGIAARGAMEETARGQNNLLANAENQRLQAMQAAGQMGGNLLQQQLAPSATMNQVGMQQRGIQQDQMGENLMRQDAELARLTGLSNINSQTLAPLIGQATTTQQPLSGFGMLHKFGDSIGLGG